MRSTLFAKGLLFAFFSGAPLLASQPAGLRIDHVVLVTENLEKGVAYFEELTGVRPEPGGEHPDGGTRNAIVPLTGSCYLEILAPTEKSKPIPELFKGVAGLEPVGVGLATSSLTHLVKRSEALKFQSTGLRNGSRRRPDGTVLRWALMLLEDPPLLMNPFYLQWEDPGLHPSGNGVAACSLQELILKTPYVKDLLSLHDGTPIDKRFVLLQENEAVLRVVIDTPKGLVIFE